MINGMSKETDKREPILRFAKDNVNKNIICAEVGVLKGDHAEVMFYYLNPKKLYLIDSWKENDYYEFVKNRFLNKIIDHKIHILNEESLTASTRFNDEFFDLVYIDGDHSYEAVMIDLNAWYPLVKKGGMLSGHDWNKPEVRVQDAVLDFMSNKKENLIISQNNRNWYFYKE